MPLCIRQWSLLQRLTYEKAWTVSQWWWIPGSSALMGHCWPGPWLLGTYSLNRCWGTSDPEWLGLIKLLGCALDITLALQLRELLLSLWTDFFEVSKVVLPVCQLVSPSSYAVYLLLSPKFMYLPMTYWSSRLVFQRHLKLSTSKMEPRFPHSLPVLADGIPSI